MEQVHNDEAVARALAAAETEAADEALAIALQADEQEGRHTGGAASSRRSHRGDQVDVDSMSYEELLALGDSIGHVRRASFALEELSRLPTRLVNDVAGNVDFRISTWRMVQRNTQLKVVSTMTDYELRFELRLLGLSNGFSSLIHFTIGSDAYDPGSRIPALFVIGRQLVVVTGTVQDPNLFWYTPELPLQRPVLVRVVVEGATASVYFDSHRVLHNPIGLRQSHNCVKVMLSDSFYPASDAEIQNLRYGPPGLPKSGDDADECCVCQEQYAAGDCVRTLPCLHAFHAQCIDKWLVSNAAGARSCPVCHTEVTL